MPALLSLALAAPALASSGRPPEPGRPPAPEAARPDPAKPDAAKPAPETSLDKLFERLLAAKDETEANGVARLIERRWSRSGSDTADLLMSRAAEAITAKEHPLAIELLDRVLALRPDWAEAWSKRALAFYLADDPISAIADLNRALGLEPRHFAAWQGLGQILYSAGDKPRAYEAFKRALAIHPHLERVKTMVERLGPEVSGRDI